MNTGYQRSLTVEIVKKVAGVVVPGYENGNKTYNGKALFVFNGIPYDGITDQELASMPYDEYEIRLADFKQYVQIQEQGLLIDATTVEGGEAYRENTEACPIG
jgi:hypothetical protein